MEKLSAEMGTGAAYMDPGHKIPEKNPLSLSASWGAEAPFIQILGCKSHTLPVQVRKAQHAFG